jgi:hypothetical protein
MAQARDPGFELRPQRSRSRKPRRRIERAFPGEGETRFHRRPVVACVGKAETEHDGPVADRSCEYLVIVRQPLKERLIDAGDVAHDAARRKTVGFGEQDVEGYRRRAHFREPVYQSGNAVARPRPLAELFQRRLVDVDDANGNVLEAARRQALVLVEGEIAGETQK